MSVATTSAQAVYDHNNIRKTFVDHNISTQAYRKIYVKTHEYDGTHVSVATLHQEVLLTGEVNNILQKSQIEALVKSLPDVKQVYNYITISAPSSTLTHASDTWITAKIKAKLISMNDINPSEIKVVTENGTVYLMGTVFPEQAEIATEVVENTEGVQSLVKLFSYIKIIPPTLNATPAV